MSERQRTILEYVKTAVILIGVVFAVIELRNGNAAIRRLQLEKTGEMISAFGQSDIVEGVKFLIDVQKLNPDDKNHTLFLASFSPLRQHLITWASCIQFDLCDSEKTLELFCRRLLGYEYSFSVAQKHFRRIYNEKARDWHYFGKIDDCRVQFPEVDAAIRGPAI